MNYPAPNAGRFPDCESCEGRGGYPCPSCTGGANDCTECNGSDWQECADCDALAGLLADVKRLQPGSGLKRWTRRTVADALARGYIDGTLDYDVRLTFKGRGAVRT